MVGDEEGTVQHESNGVVDRLVRRKGLVTALVGKHPHSGHDGALPPPVGGPSDDGDEGS